MRSNLYNVLTRFRIFKNETILDMAKKLNMSVSNLSAIQSHTKPIPKDFLKTLNREYDLIENDERRLTNGYRDIRDAIKGDNEIELEKPADFTKGMCICTCYDEKNDELFTKIIKDGK